MPTTTRQLEPGKWRVKLMGGQDVTAVRIKGMRSRGWPLHPLGHDDFHARLMKRANGEVSEAAILRGVPNSYLQEGPFLMIWPSPAHSWELQIDTVERVKA